MSEAVVFFNVSEVLLLHEQLATRFGGAVGVHNRPGLEAALGQPPLEAFGQLLHPSVPDQAAAYLFHLVANHPFRDGNKRIGLHACLIHLSRNGYAIMGE